MKKRMSFNNQMIKIWFSTYVIILIIPLAVNYFLFLHSKEIIDEEIESSRIALVNSLKKDLDEELFSLKQTAVLMGQDQKTIKLISDDRKGLTDKNKFLIIEYLDYMEVVLGSLKGKYVLLHLGQADGVLFNGTYSRGEFFYDNYLNKETYPNYGDWSNLIKAYYKNDYFLLNIKTTMGVEEAFVAYGSSLPFGSPRNSSSTLLTLVDQARLIGLLNQYKLSDEGLVFIVDDNNQIVMSTSDHIGMDNIRYEDLIVNEKSQYNLKDQQEVVVHVAESDHLPWKYVVVSDKDVYLEKDNNYNRVVGISVSIYLVMGLLAALWFSRRNYKPLGQMVQMVSKHSIDTLGQEDGSYDYLKSAFEQAFFKMDALEHKISEQKDVMRSNFLYRLLSGIVVDSDLIEASLLTYNFHYDKTYFSTVVLNVGLKSSSESSNTLGTYIKVAEYFKSIPSMENDSDYIIRDSYIIFVVNSDTNRQDSLKEALFLMVDQLKYEMTDLMSFTISVGISDVYESIDGLSEAYRESMNCLEYALMYDPEAVLQYKDIVSRGTYYYPITQEQKLINYIKSGNADEAVQTLKEIYVKNFDENKIGINMGRNLLFDISSSMLKTIDTVAMNEMNLSKDIVHAVTFTKSLHQTKEKLIASLIEVCRYYEKQQESIDKTSYYASVNTFIDTHYKNADLNISMIAEEFNLTPSYLSKLYKAESGDSILTYINKVRVREAKRLLVESDLTNGEIAMSIGILNDTSFNRIFKNLEGITPGKYRKIKG